MNPINQSHFKKLTRYITGECAGHEKSEIEAWMSKDPSRREYVDSLRQAWELSGKLPLERNSEEAWNNLSRRLSGNGIKAPVHAGESRWQKLFAARSHSSWQYTFRIAAAILLLVGAPYITFRYFAPQEDQELVMREITTGRGERVRVKFGDGTRVMLNAASSIRFPEKGINGMREVQLRGEAYFEVARVENSKFVVRTDQATVEVLGTEFNVRSYPDDKQASVVVRGGKVAVQSVQAHTGQVLLTDGKMASVTNEGDITPVLTVNVDEQLAWVDGRLVFNNTPFSEVIPELERRFDVDCAVRDSLILQRHVKVAFKEQNVTEILNVLALSLDLTYKRTGNLVQFEERRSRQ